MKKTCRKVVGALACGASVCVAALSALALEVDGVAAKVGSETILRSDVYDEMRRMGAKDDSRYAEVRNEMIDRKLILKAAADAKMTMQEWVVENRVREIVGKAFGGDRSRLIETHPERYRSDRRVSVSVILLKPEEAGRRDEISAALKEKGFEELGGRKFENVLPEEQFKPEICREIESMPKGTISKWIEIDGWSFLIRKDAESESRSLTLEEAYDDVEAAVKAAESDRLYRAWIERLRAETYIRVF